MKSLNIFTTRKIDGMADLGVKKDSWDKICGGVFL